MNTTTLLIIAALIAGLYYLTPIAAAIVGGIMSGMAQRYLSDGETRG